MTTVKQIFDIAMALSDNQVEGDSFNEVNDEYLSRTPQILNVLQNELAKKGKLKIVIERRIEETGSWMKIELPDDVNRISQVALLLDDGRLVNGCFEYYVESDENAHYFNFRSQMPGTLKIEYLQIPEMLSSKNDVVRVSDEIARGVLPYGLVANLLVEENPTIASFCEQKYEENKEASTSNLSPIGLTYQINPYGDYYGNY